MILSPDQPTFSEEIYIEKIIFKNYLYLSLGFAQLFIVLDLKGGKK